MNVNPFRTAIMMLLLVVLLIPAAAFAEGDGTVKFTNVSEGAVISKLTTLTGTIDFPDFVKYEIFLKSGSDLVWVGNSHSRIKDGNLVRLDPRVFVSGKYQLLVRQVHSDSNYIDVNGPTITIENPNETPLPYYPEVEPSFLYPSETFAIVRIRNCAGEDFNFDYHSPQDFKSSGDMKLGGKVTDGICPFTDLAWIPGKYGGTGQGGGQDRGAPIELTVEEWHTYEIIYYGGQQIQANQVAGDDKMAGPEMAQVATATPKSAKATVTPVSAKDDKAEAVPPTPMSDSKTESILPTTGDQGASSGLPMVIGLLVVLSLGAAGVVALRSRQFN